jgi:hypothetical protein
MNSNCHWNDNAQMYALGGLSEKEKIEFEAHLTACKACQQEVQDCMEVVEMLPMASELVVPPAGMKERVLTHVLKQDAGETPFQAEEQKTESIGTENRSTRYASVKKKKRGFSQQMFVTGLSAAVILLFFYAMGLNLQNNQLEQLVASKVEEIESLELAIADQTNPAQGPIELNKAVTLTPAAENIVSEGLATIVIDEKGTHLLVHADKLPALEGTEAFQVWLLKDEQPQNAGTFLPHSGQGALYYTLSDQEQDYDMVAITLEPDAHGDTPRGKMILVAALTTE